MLEKGTEKCLHSESTTYISQAQNEIRDSSIVTNYHLSLLAKREVSCYIPIHIKLNAKM
jgi:hypothetical protein